MAFYDEMAAFALEMLTEFGQVGAIRISTATDDQDELNPGTPTVVDHPATFCIFNYKTMQVDGTRIQIGDRQALIAAEGLTVVPTVADKLVVAGQAVEMVSVEPLDPSSAKAVIYTAQVRGL